MQYFDRCLKCYKNKAYNFGRKIIQLPPVSTSIQPFSLLMPCVTSASQCVMFWPVVRRNLLLHMRICSGILLNLEGSSRRKTSLSVFNHFHIENVCTFMHMHAHLILTINTPRLICDPVRSQQNDSCHSVPVPPTQQGIKDKQTSTIGRGAEMKWVLLWE